MSREPSRNVLSKAEVALVKAMLSEGSKTGQEILAYFSRPGRSINPARLNEVKRGKFDAIPEASSDELRAFLS